MHGNYCHIFLAADAMPLFRRWLFHPNPFHSALSLNSTHFLARLRDINQIRFFAKTFLPKEKLQNFVCIKNKLWTEPIWSYVNRFYSNKRFKTYDTKQYCRTRVWKGFSGITDPVRVFWSVKLSFYESHNIMRPPGSQFIL